MTTLPWKNRYGISRAQERRDENRNAKIQAVPWQKGKEVFMSKFSINQFKRIFAVCILILFSLVIWGEEKKEETGKKKKNETEHAQAAQEKKNTGKVEFSKKIFEKLPKSRDFLSIVPLVPGINRESLLDGISINGASSAENRYYIDGIDTTTLYTGESGLRVNVDFIEDVQVRTSGISAEYEGSTGGAVHVITRSGGNEFHGSAMLYFDGSALNGKPRPTLRINPMDESAAEYVTYPEDTWTGIEPGFSLGGYIIKDKLWFFGGFMPKFVTTKRDGSDWPLPGGTIFIDNTHISGSNEFTRKDTFYAGSLKLTAQPAENIRVTVNGILDYYEWKGELPPEDGKGYPEKDYSSVEYQYPVFTLGGSVDYTIRDNLRMSLGMGYYRSNEKELHTPDFSYIYHLTSNADIPGIPSEFIVPAYWPPERITDGFQVTKNINTRLTGSFDLSYDFELAGKHHLKTGLQVARIGIDIDAGFSRDYKRFFWGWDYESNSMGTVPTTLGYVEVREPYGVIGKTQSTRLAVYIQDSWTIGNKLTLNLGIRADKEDVPTFAEGFDPVIRFNFGDKLAPRVGFSYDVFGDSSLSIFGSFGIYYDVMKMELSQQKYGGFKWLSHYYDLVNWDWKNGFPEVDHPQSNGYAGGQYFETANWLPAVAGREQPDIKPFRKDEFTFGIRKTLGESWTISAAFLHNYIVNAIEDIGVSQWGGYYIGNPGSDWIQQKIDDQIAWGLWPEGIKAVKAVREYTSVTLSLDRKFKDNWFGGFSYTWSRLYGNYAGLASSDEEGRKKPNLLRYFDSWYLTYNQNGEESLGLLRTDRTHQFKCYGAYAFDFGLTVGFSAYAMSGVPLQTEIQLNGFRGFYPLGRAGEGRAPLLWQIDLYAEYNVKISNRFTLQFNANVTNLTDNDMARTKYMHYNFRPIVLYDEAIKGGFNYAEVALANGVPLDTRYKMEYDYLESIAARMGVKLMF
jgi:hypothetical protein